MSGPLDHPVTVPGALPVLTEELEAAVGIARGAAATSEAAPVHLAMSVPVRLPTAAVAGVQIAPEPADVPAGTPAGVMAPALDARAIEDEVMAELGQRIDLMFEYRLREALAPTLARAADLLIREAREEVALTLRDVVSRAVAQQIARRRTGR